MGTVYAIFTMRISTQETFLSILEEKGESSFALVLFQKQRQQCKLNQQVFMNSAVISRTFKIIFVQHSILTNKN